MSKLGCVYLTAFQLVCPECGRVGQARWTARENRVRCLGCKQEFPTKGNTYRPVTAGMSEEERRERRYSQSREWARAHREEGRRAERKYYATHRDEIAARRRERRKATQARLSHGEGGTAHG